MTTVDINADMGEGYNDKEIAPYVSSCNIACGGHYGDKDSVTTTIGIAKGNALAIGAHPSYPDKDNFGRKSMDIELTKLIDSLLSQIELVATSCKEQQVSMHHIKPHGALYNDMAKDKHLTTEILSAIKTKYPDTIIYGMSGSHVPMICKTVSLTCVQEVFADRAYAGITELMKRSEEGAVIHDSASFIRQIEQFMKSEIVDAKGERHNIVVETICLHSDTPSAAAHAKTLFQYLTTHDVTVIAP